MFFYHEPEVDIIIFNSTIGREDGTDCRFEDVNTVLFHKIDKCEKMIVVKNIIRVKKIIMDKTANKKIQASNVLKQDGFSNYLQHGVEIYGLEGIRKLDKEMRRSFAISIAIVIIEFSMNASYFMQEIGGDLGGMLLSLLAATVPTALLVAETFMLSHTRFEVFACDELLAKIDKD